MARTFPITKVYHEDVQALLSSRRAGAVIHSTGDIRASGDETEIAFRHFVRKRLPQKYLVGHGHVVDRFLTVSPQCDVIIADNSATPVLLEGKDGLQYFPYESVYAIGEVKATYYQSGRPISAFSNTIKEIKENLKRDAVPPEYIGNGISLGKGFKNSDLRPYKNPLLCFMFFLDSGDCDETVVMEQLDGAPEEHLPLMTCFLDGHVLSKARFYREGEQLQVSHLLISA